MDGPKQSLSDEEERLKFIENCSHLAFIAPPLMTVLMTVRLASPPNKTAGMDEDGKSGGGPAGGRYDGRAAGRESQSHVKFFPRFRPGAASRRTVHRDRCLYAICPAHTVFPSNNGGSLSGELY